MNRDLVEMLACPECGGLLSLTCAKEDNQKVETGTLDCSYGISYPIIKGIPRLLPKSLWSLVVERTVERLWTLLGNLVACFSGSECRNYFRHCGYTEH